MEPAQAVAKTVRTRRPVVVFDMMHPAHINFFKNVMRRLHTEGYDVRLVGLQRGKVPAILQRELPEFPLTLIGRHRGTTFSILWEANVMKFAKLLSYVVRNRPAVGVSVGSFTLGAAMSLLRKPNIQFDDDPERPKNVALEKLTATAVFFPPIIEPHANVYTYNALKEWAYLSPDYFSPDPGIPATQGVVAGNYIFVREVDTGSLNYQGQAAGLIASISAQFPEGVPVLLSLENKSTRADYPAHWTLLQEPVKDIHSLLFYAKAVVSSGDSMAREGAMLGVPAIYCGIREMKANELLMREHILHKHAAAAVPQALATLIANPNPAAAQTELRNRLRAQWTDVNRFVYDAIMAALHRNPMPNGHLPKNQPLRSNAPTPETA